MPSAINRSVLSFAGIICILATLAFSANPELSPIGRWRTIDDKTGKPRSIVSIYEEQGKIFGRVEASLNPETAGRRCDKCTDERKDQPIVGMVIIRGLQQKGKDYVGGDILDPDTGTIYHCKLRVVEQGARLSVRGYVGVSMFGRSQSWTREP